MKQILLICIAVLWTAVFAQAEDVDGGNRYDAAQLLELGSAAGECTALVELAEFAIKDRRPDQAAAFVSRFLRQFLDKYHNTPTALWKKCASIKDDYTDAAKAARGIKEDRT